MGYLFESLAARDIQVYAQALDARVYHYRERDGDLEADVVLERPDGAWMALEVKLGGYAIDQAAAALTRLVTRVASPPASLAVITGTEYAYRREDGVDVVPLGALRP